MKYLSSEDTSSLHNIDLEVVGYNGLIGKDGKPRIGFKLDTKFAEMMGLLPALWTIKFDSYDDMKDFINTLEKGAWQQEHGEI